MKKEKETDYFARYGFDKTTGMIFIDNGGKKLNKKEKDDFIEKIMMQNKLDDKKNYIINFAQHFSDDVIELNVPKRLIVEVRFIDKRTKL